MQEVEGGIHVNEDEALGQSIKETALSPDLEVVVEGVAQD